MSAHERTGWRDQQISERHRGWGYNCLAVDVDFLLIEYDQSIPVAIIDYKLGLDRDVKTRAPNHRAQQHLHYRHGSQYVPVPHYVVTYRTEPDWMFRILAVGAHAYFTLESSGTKEGAALTELEYVKWLYRMRHMQQESLGITAARQVVA